MPKAWVLHDVGNIIYEDVPILEPKEGEVLIKVGAVGICGSDIPRIYKTGAHVMPIIPGHEFSGTVEAVGKGADQELIGKRAAVSPKIACGKCSQCKSGRTDLCRDYGYIGSRRDGAFAEYVTAPAENLLEIPDSVSFEVAAMFEPMAVAAGAVRTSGSGESKGNRSAAVCGLGTIGMMVVMFLKEAGYDRIYVIGNRESQRKRVIELGIPAENYFEFSSGDAAEWLKDISDGGVDVFYECVGKNESISCGIEASAPGGSVILVGNPYSDMTFPKDVYWKILRDKLVIRGVWNSTFGSEDDDWHYILEKIAEGKIDPDKLITHRLSLEELEAGLHIMRDKTEDYCKVMVTFK